jgi:ABC-type sugar transport system ATPase subunit
MAGEPFAPRNPREAIRAGLALAPEDRKQHGLILQMAVRENASLASLSRDQQNGFLNFNAEEKVATEAVEQLAADGVAILFVSSELEEVLGMADRALVMHEGRLAGELARDQLSEQAVMQLATGTPLAA